MFTKAWDKPLLSEKKNQVIYLKWTYVWWYSVLLLKLLLQNWLIVNDMCLFLQNKQRHKKCIGIRWRAQSIKCVCYQKTLNLLLQAGIGRLFNGFLCCANQTYAWRIRRNHCILFPALKQTESHNLLVLRQGRSRASAEWKFSVFSKYELAVVLWMRKGWTLLFWTALRSVYCS